MEWGKKYKEGKSKNNNYGNFKSNENPSAKKKGDTKKYPRTTLFYQKPHPPIHPIQKPIGLCQYIVRTYTNEGETILDNCIGIGSIPMAFIRENRNFIAFEKNAKFYNKAKN